MLSIFFAQKKFKNRHGNRRKTHRKKVDDESEMDVANHTCYDKRKMRDSIDYIRQHNNYTLIEYDIQSQLDQMQIANIKSKWHCSSCTFINSKNDLFCKCVIHCIIIN